jgi:Tol biopolymer transport system component
MLLLERPMDPVPSGSTSETESSHREDRLDSWKEIAAYLNRSVRTLHRWEKDEGLPVHRHQHKELGSVFAYKGELDAWVTARSPDPDLQAQNEQPASAPRSLVSVALTVAAAVLVIGVISYLVASRFRSDRGQGNTPVSGLELISTFAGSHRWPSPSPDGRMVAFVSDAASTPQVWVKNLDGGDPIQITFGDLPALRPRWSARGDRIIYSVRGGGIWSVAPLGGEPGRIVENGWNADLSPDGQRLVFERDGQILTAKGDGSEVIPLAGGQMKSTPYYGDAWPTFSPDGTSIAVFLGEEGRYGDYWVMPSAGGAPRRLTTDFQEGGAPAWTPDGKFLVFPSARAGSVNLWRVSVAGGVPDALTTGPGDDLDPVVSPDGRTLLFANVKRTWAVVVHDVKSDVRKTLVEKRTPIVFPSYSPNGHRIALAGKNSRGDTHLFVMNADGSNLTPVTDGAGEINIRPRWDSDGDTLYFYQVRPRATFRSISVSGSASREIAPWSLRRQPAAEVDRRGRTAVYSAVDQGYLQHSRARDLETGQETTLPFALYEHRFSRDGQWIAGESRDGELVLCAVSTGRCRPLTPKDDAGLTGLAWSADGTRLFFLRPTSARVFGELTSVSIEGGDAKTHGPIGPFQQRFQMSMDVSPRDEIVFAPCREGPHELWMAKLR